LTVTPAIEKDINMPSAQASASPIVKAFFDEDSNTFSYVVSDPDSDACAIIDSVLNFDQASGTTSEEGADLMIDYIARNKLQLTWILETHVHADHLSAAPYIQEQLGGKQAIGSAITTVQETFGGIFNEGAKFRRDGSQFDQLLNDGDTLEIGKLEVMVLHTPGHTPACMTFVIGDAVFVGDTLFMPDGGTARADFPGGDARILYQSIQRILDLPAHYRVFVCHDYCPNDRGVEYESTIGQEKKLNIHVGQTTSENGFVQMRETRDATLGMPQLILPSLQINMRAGHLPPADDSGAIFLKLPVNAFK
jgi:glyoxylase-like metal-dependent hydrolase (beta-lactamase superfamily II)